LEKYAFYGFYEQASGEKGISSNSTIAEIYLGAYNSLAVIGTAFALLVYAF
jgi:hypothetical protein